MARAVVASLVAVAHSDVAWADSIAPKCASLLRGVSASGHSDAEIGAFCRAAYTPEMCGAMRTSLGPMPWASSRIDATCEEWNARVQAGSEDRVLMDYDDFQKTLEASANQKAAVGYQMPRNADGTVDLDKACQMKYEQTQTVIRAYYTYMGETTLAPMGPQPSQSGWRGLAPTGPQPSQSAQRELAPTRHPFSQSGRQGLGSRRPQTSRLWAAGRGVVVSVVEDARLAACSALAVLGVAAAVAVGLVRAARAGRRGVPLVESSVE